MVLSYGTFSCACLKETNWLTVEQFCFYFKKCNNVFSSDPSNISGLQVILFTMDSFLNVYKSIRVFLYIFNKWHLRLKMIEVIWISKAIKGDIYFGNLRRPNRVYHTFKFECFESWTKYQIYQTLIV